MPALPRMDLHLRLQHGILLTAVLSALGTGFGMALGFIPAAIGFGVWYRVHVFSGGLAALLVVYHLFYMLVRGYVEGLGWERFPMLPRRGSGSELAGEIAFVLGRRGEPPPSGLFRSSQKLLYWGTMLIVSGLALSGLRLFFWEDLGGTGWLGHVAQLHRGLSLFLFASLLWHLYDVLTWRGSWNPQWSWLSGEISEELAAGKVPGFHREQMRLLRERAEVLDRPSGDELNEVELLAERTAVEEELRRGNELAKIERFDDAVACYRRALEKYPAYSQARFNLAVTLQKMGKTGEAVQNFQLFLRDDPFHPLARTAQKNIAALQEEDS